MAQLGEINWPWAEGVFDAPNTGDLSWKLPYDPSIVTDDDMRQASFVASDALHHVRSALDHLVYNVSWADQGAPQKATQFPIVDKAEDWSSALTTKRLGGMSQQHATWIESIQPYNGVQWTRILRDLSNSDKHRVGVEVSPTVEFEIDAGSVHADPTNPARQRAAIKTVKLYFLLPAVSQYGREITKVFNEMFLGAGDLINKFLTEAGMPLIQMKRPGQN